MIFNMDSNSKEIKELKKEVAENTSDVELNKKTLGYSCKNYYDAAKTKLVVRGDNKITYLEVNAGSVHVYTDTQVDYASTRLDIDYSKMKVGKTYTISADALYKKGTGRLSIRSKTNKILLSSSNITTSGKYSLTFTLPEDECYISLFVTVGTAEIGDITYSNIQVEDGEKVTDYEPYSESVNDMLGGCRFKYENGKFYIGHEDAELEV